MNRIRNLLISMACLFAIEFVRIGVLGLGPTFASGFEFTMTAFAVTWISDGVAAQGAGEL